MGFKFNPITGGFDLVNPNLPDAVTSVNGQTGAVVLDIYNYSETFTTLSWVGPTSDTYSYTVLKSTHLKDNPTVQVYELSGINYNQVEVGIQIDASDNVIITVAATPDMRFNGKITIT